MKQAIRKRAALSLLLLALCATAVQALGTETFGNEPLNDANYKEFPGLMPSINQPSRVYSTWVNGNEQFYFKGDSAALDAALGAFSGAEAKVREVVLRPGPGDVKSFDGSKTIPFDWDLHINGGVSRYVTMLPDGDKVWSRDPVLTVYVRPELDLARLHFSKALTVVSVERLKESMRSALSSKDKTVRGWGAGELARLDPYDAKDRDAIATLLKDPDNWVRHNAVGALTLFGSKARGLLPQLREVLNTDDAQLKEAAAKSIQEIEAAPDRTAEERVHQQLLRQIETVVAALKK